MHLETEEKIIFVKILLYSVVFVVCRLLPWFIGIPVLYLGTVWQDVMESFSFPCSSVFCWWCLSWRSTESDLICSADGTQPGDWSSYCSCPLNWFHFTVQRETLSKALIYWKQKPKQWKNLHLRSWLYFQNGVILQTLQLFLCQWHGQGPDVLH